MARTKVRKPQIKTGTIQRRNMNVSTPAKAVVTKIIAGTGVTLSETGIDSGTGDVTLNGQNSNYWTAD